MSSCSRRSRSVAIFCLTAVTVSVHVAFAQQSPAAAGEKEFFEAIRKGASARVTEMVKQQPSLMKATYRNGITPVMFAVYTKHPEIADALFQAGVEPNIFEATATGRIGRVRELLGRDPSLVHAWSPDGWTALHLNFNNLEMAKLLIDAGSDLDANSRNKLNATPLQGAAANNWIELAKLYLSRGANVNCRSEGGGSPLHEAAGNGFVEFARLLLDKGANVNQKDDSGKTPLTTALEAKQPETAKFLRERGGTQ
jgi:ankyrin repeat protein